MENLLATRKDCGCTVIYLAQGLAVLPCVKHQAGVLAAIEPQLLVPDGSCPCVVQGDVVVPCPEHAKFRFGFGKDAPTTRLDIPPDMRLT